MSSYSELEFDPDIDITYLMKLKQELFELKEIEKILDSNIKHLNNCMTDIKNKFDDEDNGSFHIIEKKGNKARKIGVVTNAKKIS